MRTHRLTVLLVSSAVLAAAFVATKVEGQDAGRPVTFIPSRVLERVDDGKLVKLAGHTHPMARAEFDLGAVEAHLPMERMHLVLRRSAEQEAALETFMAEQQDPASPNFHHWLHASELGAMYGVSDADVQKTTVWLESHGFRVDGVSGSRMMITFSGTAAQVGEAFHTEIHRYNVRGEERLSNNVDPSIPEALSPVVVGVKSLNNFFAKPAHVSRGNVRRDKDTGKWSSVDGAAVAVPGFNIGLGAGSPSLEEVTPYDFATIYNVLPLWNAGIDGTGVGIAIAGRSDISLTDVATFRAAFGLPVKAPAIIVNGTDPGVPSSGDKEENSLDVEWSGAVAKNADVTLVTTASTATDDGSFDSAEYIIENETAHIMSYSYQSCELEDGPSGNAAFNTLWQTAAAAGITAFVASGDYGAAQCDGGENGPYLAKDGLFISGLSSSPYDTAVGGTDFNWGNLTTTYWATTNASNGSSALGYIPEVPWNQTCASNAVDAFYGFTKAGFDAEQSCQYDITNNFDTGLVNAVGGSGGKSSCISPTGTTPATCAPNGGYPKPSWQTGTGVPNDSARDVPDVSLFASSNALYSAYLVCDSAVGMCDYSASATDAEMQAVGGTSVASPAMAGIMAMVVQHTKANQGLANPTFYKLAAQDNLTSCNSVSVAAGNACTFYDVTTDSIEVPCAPNSLNCTVHHTGDTVGLMTGQVSTTGYDLATGLGSVNAKNLVYNWPASTGPSISISPTTLTFASTAVGTTTAAQMVTITNTGTSAITFSTASAISGTNASSFIKSAATCPDPLPAGQSCTNSIEFDPTAAGALSAVLTIYDNAGGPHTVALSGTGAGGGLSVTASPTSLSFAATAVGATSAAQMVTIKNTGTMPLTLNGNTFTGTNASSFIKSATTCVSPLAAGASCTNSIEFTPTVAGALTGYLNVNTNAPGSPVLVALSGTGGSGGLSVTASPTSLSFAATAIGATSAAQMVTIKNTGTMPLTLTGNTFTGTNASSFIKSATTCVSPLAAGASCTNSIEFTPTVAGSLTGYLNVNTNAPGSPVLVALSGTGGSGGLSVTASPSSLSFASTAVGGTSAAQMVTIKNTGTMPLTLTGNTFTGTNASSFIKSATTCVSPLAAGASCTNSIEFTPTVAGSLTGYLNVNTNAPGSPVLVALSGTGTGTPTISISPTTMTFASTAVGTTTAAQMVTISNTGTTAITFSTASTIGGTNAGSFIKSAATCPDPLPAGQSCTNSIEFKPAATGALSGTLTIYDNAGGPHIVTLSGTGH